MTGVLGANRVGLLVGDHIDCRKVVTILLDDEFIEEVLDYYSVER